MGHEREGRADDAQEGRAPEDEVPSGERVAELSPKRWAVIGLDQGSSATKAVVVRGDGVVLGDAVWPIRTKGDKVDTFEHDPAEILNSVRAAVTWGTARGQEGGAAVVGMGLATQRSGVVAWRNDGSPLSTVLSWRDGRGSAAASELLSSTEYIAEIEARTGLTPNHFFAAPKVRLLQELFPEASSQVTTLDSFLIAGLTGDNTPVTDDSMASRTLLYDLGEHRWSPLLCQLWGVDQQRLPRIRPSILVPGTFLRGGEVVAPSEIKGLKRCLAPFRAGRCNDVMGVRVPLLAVLGDKEASVLGALGLEETGGPRRFVIDLGTLITMTGVASEIPSPVEGVGRGVLCSVGGLGEDWGNGGGDRRFWYQQELRSSASGDTLDWLRQRLGADHSLERLGEMSAGAPAHEGVLFGRARTGSVVGCRPLGGVVPFEPVGEGLSDDELVVISAALENILFSVADLIEWGISRGLVSTPAEILVSGGLTRIPGFCQKLATLVPLPLLMDTEVASGSAIGAAWLARGAALGVVSSEKGFSFEPRRVARKQLEPADSATGASVRSRFERWKRLRDRVNGKNRFVTIFKGAIRGKGDGRRDF